MRLFIYDTNSEFTEFIKKSLNENIEVIIKNKFDESSTKDLKNDFCENDFFLINCEFKNIDLNRQDFKGIRILKWLRLMEIKNHIILYSFLCFTKIVRLNPENCIIFSKGVTFLQAPLDAIGCIKNVSKEKAERDNLLPFFRAEIDLKSIRHKIANYYGLNKLVDMHRQINPDFKIKSPEESYEFKLLKWVYSRSRHFEIASNTKKTLQSKIEEIKKFKSRIAFLDDKSTIGWTELLKDILGENITVLKLDSNDNAETLFKKYQKLRNNKTIDLFICDLKLKDSEDNLTDYTKLLSYQLISKIRNENKKQKIMYFTATNDLNKYKHILKNKIFNPQIIFTKEGVDQMYSDDQSFHNYKYLIESLDSLLKSEGAKSQIDKLEIINKIEANKIIKLKKQIENAMVNVSIEESVINSFDIVVFDSNAFMNENDSIEIFKHVYNYPTNVLLHKAVYFEIKRIANDDKKEENDPIAFILAKFFLKYIDEFLEKENTNFSLSELGMTLKELKQAESGYLKKDFADIILVKAIKELVNQDKNKKILFVSNDRAQGFRKSKNQSDGPVPILSAWKAQESKSNLSIFNTREFLKVYI